MDDQPPDDEPAWLDGEPWDDTPRDDWQPGEKYGVGTKPTSWDHCTTCGADLNVMGHLPWCDTTARAEHAHQRGLPCSEDAIDLLNQPEEDYDWAIPGLLEHGDRLILTGPEGGGKSTLLRQLGVKAAAGAHPFTDEAIEPLRILLVDLENGRRHVRRQLRPLVLSAHDLKRGQLLLEIRTEGLDLLRKDDRQWLTERIVNTQPEILIVGPVYKLVGGDPTAEEPARIATRCLDELRADHAFALIVEAHTPYASTGNRRPERPYGASLWSRWPEFGIYLSQEGAVRHWRGPRDERDWPIALTRGGQWPWTVQENPRAATLAQMIEACREAGEIPSNRALAGIISTSEATVRRAIEANPTQWDHLKKDLDH